jgi:hypothetical protein
MEYVTDVSGEHVSGETVDGTVRIITGSGLGAGLGYTVGSKLRKALQ